MAEQTMVEILAEIIGSGIAANLPSAYIARNVLDAMREPTAEMIEAMEDSYQPDEVWRAMIDAALAPRAQCDKPT